MRSHRPLARVHSHRPLPPACTRRYNEDSKLKEEKRLRQEEANRKRAEEMKSRKVSVHAGAAADGGGPPPPTAAGARPPSLGGPPLGMPGLPGARGIGVDSELAAKLARRNAAAAEKTDLVDGVGNGMANGIRVRQLSFHKRRNPPPAAPKPPSPLKAAAPPQAAVAAAAAPPPPKSDAALLDDAVGAAAGAPSAAKPRGFGGFLGSKKK